MRQSKLTLAVMMLAGVMFLLVTGCEKSATSDSSGDAGDSGNSSAATPSSQPG